MCDNTAVRWSEYEMVRRQQDTEVRLKIAVELLKHIDMYRENDYSPEYIQGMERARLLVLFDQSPKSDQENSSEQETLF